MRPRQPDNAKNASKPASEESQKLQKVIAATGRGSRRQIEELIAAGRVTVNGEVAHLGQRVTAGEEIVVDGAAIEIGAAQVPQVLVLNKSAAWSAAGETPKDAAQFSSSCRGCRADGGLPLGDWISRPPGCCW